MKQILSKETCLKCQGCCRFAEAATVWAPCLLDKEIKALFGKSGIAAVISADKRIRPVASGAEDVLFCPFLSPRDNKCKIYSRRPFECRLYPFIINSSAGKTYLAVDTNCPFVKEKFTTKSFKDHAAYLARLLNNRAFHKVLKNNPQIIQFYPGAVNVAEIIV
jgi:uncharacterized protein